MTPTRSSRRDWQLARYVWGLALVAVTGSIAVTVLYSQLIAEVTRDREESAAKFNAAKEMLGRVQTDVLTAQAQVGRILSDDDPDDPPQEAPHIALERGRGHLRDAALLSRSLDAALRFFEDVSERADRWHEASTQAAKAQSDAIALVHQRIDELSGQVELLAGRMRLEQVGASRGETVVGSRHGPANANFADLRAEIGRLDVLVLNLAYESKLDNLIGIKDNAIGQSLRRVRRMVLALERAGDATDEPSIAQVDGIESALFGPGGIRDAARESSVEPGAGMYALRHVWLRLVEEHAQLAAETARVTESINGELRTLLDAAHDGLNDAGQRTQGALETAQTRMKFIGVGVLVLFLAVCTYILRAIRRQVLELEAALESLARANGALEQAIEQVSLLSTAVSTAANAIVVCDRDGTITWVNPALTTLTGHAREDVLGAKYDVLSARADPDPDRTTKLLAGEVWQGETIGRRKDGSTFHEHETLTPVTGKDGGVTHFIAIKRNITDEKRSAEELREANAEIEMVLRSVSAILIGITPDRRVRTWNEHADAILGKPAAAVPGATLEELGLRWELAKIVAGVRACVSEGKETHLDDVAFTRPDGTAGILGIVLRPMFDASGASGGCVLLGRDITDQRSLEIQLANAQKLEAIGRLAAGVAHEINTPTQYVGDNIRFLQEPVESMFALCRDLDEITAATGPETIEPERKRQIRERIEQADLEFLCEEMPAAIRQSLEGIDRIASIVRAMKEFSHPGTQNKSLVDLNQALESTQTVGRNEWKYVADMETDFDPNLPLVPCLAGELNQVFLNIIVNAAHAIGDVVGDGGKGKGTIKLATKACGDWVEIRISDTGCGIPPENMSKIFEHFFTTKGVGKGTGQGLAIAHAVVTQKHGGTIDVESEVGRGTTFIIRLPVVPAEDETLVEASS